ncbi:MAG: MYG1 family protein [Clostridia bacterium]|nr:MYG1 family protein [Clostridia bacterium]
MEIEKQLKRVGTHSGRFHADEVMATAILKEIFELEIVRTRDPEVLNGLDIVYDVGGGEFDHHQMDKEYRERGTDRGTPYAACGLIWRNFGQEVVRRREPSLTLVEVEDVFQYIDGILIEGIDAADNGLRTCETIIPIMNISSIIAGFNPPWDSGLSEDIAFNEAVRFASAALENTIDQQISAVKAKRYVLEAYEKRTRPQVLMLDASYPWARTLGEIDKAREVLFVIYPRGDEYLIQTVRENGRRDRKKLPKSWAGKREEELGEILGIQDAVFCHSSRFIAGAKSLESILKMADIAIAEPEEVVRRGFFKSLKRFFLRRRLLIRW